jgi:hypothetical protein
MLFQISYSLIRASPVLLTCFYFDFSLYFATFVYTFILCFFFYLYPSFFFSRLLHIILYSYSLYFLFTEHILLLLQSALQPLVGFRPAQLSLSILSRKVLLSAVASGTSDPQLGEEPGI